MAVFVVSVNAGVGMVKVYCVDAVATPGPLARTVIDHVPGVTVGPTSNETIALVADPDRVVGANVAVTPAGTPSALSTTVPE
jgi:hypothetical protein